MSDTKSKLQNFLDRFLGRDGKGSLRQRVTNNEKKITLLKNIVRGPKAISQGFRDLGKSPIEPLEDIHESLDELLAVIRQDAKLDDQKAEYQRLKKEREARDAKEKKLENTKWEGVKKLGEKILKPFQSIWDTIWGFVSKILLGNILMKILGWMGDKKNQDKLKNIFKFMKDWWPALLASYLLFGNAFGRMIVGITAKVALWTATIVKQLIPQLAAALVKLKASKFAKFLGGGKGKALLMTGGLMMATPGLVDRFTDGGEDDINIEPSQEFATGGVVRGPGGVDKVPARLTAGEFVMSRGAVQKWGAGTLASMNAAGGGTNIPSLNYNQGGPVFNFENGGVVGNLPTTLGGGGGGLNALTEQAKVRLKEHQGLFGRVRGGLDMLTGNRWDFDRQDVVHDTIADRNRTGYENYASNDDSRWENIPGTGLQRLKVSVNTGPQKSITPINPPVKIAPSTTNAKNVVKPPSSKRNVVQAYNQEKMRQQTVGGMIEGETGTKIPDFDANVYSSTEKIKVMGISL